MHSLDQEGETSLKQLRGSIPGLCCRYYGQVCVEVLVVILARRLDIMNIEASNVSGKDFLDRSVAKSAI